MTKFKLVIFFLVYSSISFSQNNYYTKTLLKLISPATHDTVSYSKIRISGSTRPEASVTINGKRKRIFQSGAFVDLVNLKTGLNNIKICVSCFSEDTTVILKIFRVAPISVSPVEPTEIDNRIMLPDENITLIPNDYLEVRFKGSPGGRAMFSINKICKNIPMTELVPKDASGMAGIYSGVIKINVNKKVIAKPVKFELRGRNGKKVKALSPGLISVLPDKVPIIGETIKQTYLKSTPNALSVLSIMPKGVQLHIIGRIGDFFKVNLLQKNYAYVSVKNIQIKPVGTPIPKTGISLPSISFDRDWIQLNMQISTACPYTVKQTVDPATLELTVYGAHLISQWITYPELDSTIKMIRWFQPSADIFKLFVDLNQKQQWGHRIRFVDGKMIFEIRKAPKIAELPKSPVSGLIFALDAGHGGSELGAVGPTGLMEKDVNLIYTKKLAVLLDSAGAQVILTRRNDIKMSLANRIKIARQTNAHIFCWLHNNSVGATSNAQVVRGASTYFTIPQNQELAWTIYPHLLDIGLNPFGKVQSDYYVTRQTDMLNVLVEGAFMSNPEDEMLLMTDSFLDKLARAVYKGLEEFCNNQRKVN